MKDFILIAHHKSGKQSLTVQNDVDDIVEQLTTYNDVTLVLIKRMEKETQNSMWAYPIYMGPPSDTIGIIRAVQNDEPIILTKWGDI